MKKLLAMAMMTVMMLTFAGCGNGTGADDVQPAAQINSTGGMEILERGSSEAVRNSVSVTEAVSSAASEAKQQTEPDVIKAEQETSASATAQRRISLDVDGTKLTATLYDTPTANALYERLPLDLTFEDFNGIEKISYLTDKLPTQGEPDGCDPDVGDLCLYAPWGNLSIFYNDFRYSESLIMLGHIDGGMDVISGETGSFHVRIEAVQ